MYITTWDTIYQYDVTAANIAASVIKVAGVPDGDNLAHGFLFAQLAYDQKIYIASAGATPLSFHTISAPDSEGVACNVQLNSIYPPYGYDNTLPNYPNYRLGPVTGSVCDSLIAGIENINSFQYKLSVYPNPSKEIFHLQFNDVREQTKIVSVKDILGREVFYSDHNIGEINLSKQTAGIYFLQVQTKNGRLYSVKLVKE